MGYTHYWYRPEKISPNKFNAIAEDFKKVLPTLKNLLNEDMSEFDYLRVNNNEIVFNGVGENRHETMYFPRYDTRPNFSPKKKTLKFDFCKTERKPYDIAVCTLLIIAKHHLKNMFIVRSDGEIENDYNTWKNAMKLCQKFLGYGLDFKLDNNTKA